MGFWSGGLLNAAAETGVAGWRLAKRSVFPALFVISMAFNLAAWASGTVGTILGGAIETLTTLQTPAKKVVVAEGKAAKAALTVTAAEKKAAVAAAREAKAAEKLAAATGREVRLAQSLAAQTRRAASLYGELVGRHIELNKLRHELVVVSRAWLRARMVIKQYGTMVRKTLAKWGGDKLISIYGRAAPYVGTLVTVADTGLDLAMTCDMMKEMDTAEQAILIEAPDDLETARICGLKVPTADEVWAGVKASPAAAWASARQVLNALPDRMPDIPQFDWPEVHMPEIAMPHFDMPQVDWTIGLSELSLPDWLTQP